MRINTTLSHRCAGIFALTACLAWIAGCGGGAGLSLSGGSIPGGRAVTGIAVQPNSQPVANATVSVVALPSGQTLSSTTTTASGGFTATGVSTASDAAVLITAPDGSKLKAVIPHSQLADGATVPLNIGQVNASTTLVCEAVQRVAGLLPEDTSDIVQHHGPPLRDQADQLGDHNEGEQDHWEHDDQYRHDQAGSIIQRTADAELAQLAGSMDAASAAVALSGLNDYLVVVRNVPLRLQSTTKDNLINAQLAGRTFTPVAVAAALNAAGLTKASDSDVRNGSDEIRRALPSLARFGGGITAYEALAIGAAPTGQKGFQLSQSQLDLFLNALLGP